jgi:hypothetical protein
MSKYAIEPQRDALKGEDTDETQFVLCSEDDAELWALFDFTDPDGAELVGDYPSRSAAGAAMAMIQATD